MRNANNAPDGAGGGLGGGPETRQLLGVKLRLQLFVIHYAQNCSGIIDRNLESV